jgi:hypothetical protein
MEGSSFSGLLTIVEIGHIRIGSAGNGRIKSRGFGSSLSVELRQATLDHGMLQNWPNRNAC